MTLFEEICKPVAPPEIVRRKGGQTSEAEGEEEEEQRLRCP